MLGNSFISNLFYIMFSDQMQHLIIYRLWKKLGVHHVQRQQYRCFNIEWAWSKIFEFSNFGDGMLELVQSRYSMPSATQQSSIINKNTAVV